MFAPSTTVHGSLVDVYGCGLLFTGRSAIGKSETALDLVERGHRLVADDVVTITRGHGDVLIGTGTNCCGTTWRSAAWASSTCSRSSASAASGCRSGSRCRWTCACGPTR